MLRVLAGRVRYCYCMLVTYLPGALVGAGRTLGSLFEYQRRACQRLLAAGVVRVGRFLRQSLSITKRYFSRQISSPSRSALSPTRRHASATRAFAPPSVPRSASSARPLPLATRLLLKSSCAWHPAPWTSPCPRVSSTATLQPTRSPAWLPRSTRWTKSHCADNPPGRTLRSAPGDFLSLDPSGEA